MTSHNDRREWRPISEAPKDKPIWGIDIDHGYEAKVIFNGTEWECINYRGYGTGTGFYPTHWMPLQPFPRRKL